MRTRQIPMYVLGSEEQEILLANLVITETIDGGWTKKLVDQNSGDTWILYYPNSSLHGGGPRFLRKEAVPEDPVEWVIQCLESSRRDDAVGVATDLSQHYETWVDLIDYLESDSASFPREQINVFINTLGILHPHNRYPVVGKQYSEIAADAAFFIELSQRASALVKID